MPAHDWASVNPAVFFDFRFGWIVELSGMLNSGLLPKQYYAMLENPTRPVDEVIRGVDQMVDIEKERESWLATIEPSLTDEEQRNSWYAQVSNRIVVRRVGDDRAVAVVDIALPEWHAVAGCGGRVVSDFAAFCERGLSICVVDLFSSLGLTMSLLAEKLSQLRADDRYSPLTASTEAIARWRSGGCCVFSLFEEESDITHFCRRDMLPEVSLWLSRDEKVTIPLEIAYSSAFLGIASIWRDRIEAGVQV